ncbi:MAG: ABC transporter ATP-binding protein [Peptoniphilaceae bacterium]|nr:ABC transporter ATP-binding protein [Peptoniphilaceae bacterium]MDY6019075.1 ABC transporter ATP-binding protein [Anaerococcus sp.]
MNEEKQKFKFIKITPIFIIFILVSMVSNLESYFLTRLVEIISKIALYKSKDLIYYGLKFFMVWSIVSILLRYYRAKLKGEVSAAWNIRVKNDLMANILNRAALYYDSKDKASYISLFNNDLKYIEENFLFSIEGIISNFFLLTLCLAYGFRINVELTLIIFVFGIVLMIIAKAASSSSADKNESYMSSLNKYNESLNDGFYGYSTLYRYNKTKAFLKRFNQRTEKLEKDHGVSIFFNNKRISLVNIISIILQTFLMLLSAIFIYKGKIDEFYLPVLISLMNIIIYPMQEIADAYGNIISSRKIRKRIEKETSYIEEKRLATNHEVNKAETSNSNKYIYFDSLDFSYGDKKIFDRVSFEIEKKEHVIISGQSGSGKSTILKLLTKEIYPSSGNIYLENKNLESIQKDELFKLISVIPQHPMIFRESILENIILYEDKEEIDQKKLSYAIEKSGLNSLIKSLDKGIDTVLKDSGSNLSGGEKQRIEIARALYKDTPIILIDEATSALDLGLALSLEEIFSKLDKTLISISHRRDIDYKKYYDKIIKIENMKILSKKL